MRTIADLIGDAPVLRRARAAPPRADRRLRRERPLPAGETLFREGEPADVFFLIRRGSVALELAVPQRDAADARDPARRRDLGWSWLFPPYRWQFDGAGGRGHGVIAFDGACLRGKCEADHELGYELMRRFAAVIVDRLQATRLRLLDVYGGARVG